MAYSKSTNCIKVPDTSKGNSFAHYQQAKDSPCKGNVAVPNISRMLEAYKIPKHKFHNRKCTEMDGGPRDAFEKASEFCACLYKLYTHTIPDRTQQKRREEFVETEAGLHPGFSIIHFFNTYCISSIIRLYDLIIEGGFWAFSEKSKTSLIRL